MAGQLLATPARAHVLADDGTRETPVLAGASGSALRGGWVGGAEELRIRQGRSAVGFPTFTSRSRAKSSVKFEGADVRLEDAGHTRRRVLSEAAVGAAEGVAP